MRPRQVTEVGSAFSIRIATARHRRRAAHGMGGDGTGSDGRHRRAVGARLVGVRQGRAGDKPLPPDGALYGPADRWTHVPAEHACGAGVLLTALGRERLIGTPAHLLANGSAPLAEMAELMAGARCRSCAGTIPSIGSRPARRPSTGCCWPPGDRCTGGPCRSAALHPRVPPRHARDPERLSCGTTPADAHRRGREQDRQVGSLLHRRGVAAIRFSTRITPARRAGPRCIAPPCLPHRSCRS